MAKKENNLLMNIYIVSDHAGTELKKSILQIFPNIIDLSHTNNPDDDYPDFANLLASTLSLEPTALGIAICGSGQGICMSLNRYNHIRAGLIIDLKQVKSSKEHNHANVLCLSQKFTDQSNLKELVDSFVNTPYDNNLRHIRRIKKIS